MLEDLSGFWIFKQVADLGSFTRAAEAEGLNKNSVSLRIKALEKRLGVKLFGRTTSKVWLTEAGKRYYEAYSLVAQELGRARDKLAGKEAKTHHPGGLLSILAPALFSRVCLGPLLTEFLRKNPGLEVVLSSEDDALSFDLVLRFGSPTEEEKTILHHRKVLVAATSYLAQTEAPTTIEKLASFNCLRRMSEERWRLVGPRGETLFEPRGNFSFSDEGALLSAILSGAGIGLLPLYAIQREALLGALTRVLPEYGSPAEPLVASYPKGEFSSPWARFFVDFLQERMG